MINLTSDELVERLKKDKNSYLLDVRTNEEYEDSHIPDSNVKYKDPQLFMDGIQKLDKTKLLCLLSFWIRSVQACQIMKSLVLKTYIIC